MKTKRWLLFVSSLLTGCGQSALDACADSKAQLWNPKIEDNRYEGNERYWDAVKQCENKGG